MQAPARAAGLMADAGPQSFELLSFDSQFQV